MKSVGTVVLSLLAIVAGLFFFLCSTCSFIGVFDTHSSGRGLDLLFALIFLALTIGSAFAVARLNRHD